MPGQPGAKKLIEKYGDNLVCVRYRYDIERRRRIKTVEIIVEEGPVRTNARKIPQNKIMYIRIAYNETYLRKIIKDAGGRWNYQKQVWELAYKHVLELGLSSRVVGG